MDDSTLLWNRYCEICEVMAVEEKRIQDRLEFLERLTVTSFFRLKSTIPGGFQLHRLH